MYVRTSMYVHTGTWYHIIRLVQARLDQFYSDNVYAQDVRIERGADTRVSLEQSKECMRGAPLVMERQEGTGRGSKLWENDELRDGGEGQMREGQREWM